MTAQIFFLHSAGAQGPHEGSHDLVAWLKEALGPRYDVLHPEMPNPETPDYAPWKAELKKDFAELKGKVIFIGHSLGGSVLLKYLSEEPLTNPVAGLSIVSAPFWGGDENWQYEPFTLSEDFAQRLPDIPRVFLYHSANDPIVPFAHQALYAERLPRATVRRLDGDEHVWSLGLPELAADIKSLQ